MADEVQDLIVEQRREDRAMETALGRLTFLAFVLIVFGIIPLGGLPGLLIFELFAHTLISVLPGSHTWCRLYPEAIVPLTLCLTFLWPPSLPVGYAIAFGRFRAHSKSCQTVIWLALIVGWGALLSVGLCLAGARLSAGMPGPDEPYPPARRLLVPLRCVVSCEEGEPA